VKKVSYIKIRIKELAENSSLSKEKFFEKIGTTPANFRGKKLNTGVNSEIIATIVSIYPDTDLHWLITGEHKKVETHALNEPEANYKKPDKDLLIEVLNENRQLNKEIRSLQECKERLKKDNNIVCD